MRLEGKPTTGAQLSAVMLYLSDSEAAELRDALEDLLASESNPGWHAHVSSADYQTEIGLARQE